MPPAEVTTRSASAAPIPPRRADVGCRPADDAAPHRTPTVFSSASCAGSQASQAIETFAAARHLPPTDGKTVGFEISKIRAIRGRGAGIPAAAQRRTRSIRPISRTKPCARSFASRSSPRWEGNVAPGRQTHVAAERRPGEFDRKCQDTDPDAHSLFQAAIRPVQTLAPASARVRPASGRPGRRAVENRGGIRQVAGRVKCAAGSR